MVFAGSSDEALQAIESERPDCVVLDACTSADEGAPVWSRLRQTPCAQDIPLLLYSSSERWQRVAELAGAEVDGVISRPFTPDVLLSAAHHASSRRGAVPV
jgi:CheY-like chemotaxis protein